MIRVLAHLLPIHPSPATKLSLFLSLPVCRRSVGEMWEGVGGRGAKSHHHEKAFPSTNHLTLFGVWCMPRHFQMQICESTYFARTGAHLSEHGAHYQAWRQLSEIMNAIKLKSHRIVTELIIRLTVRSELLSCIVQMGVLH
jgi:hypothetical protein